MNCCLDDIKNVLEIVSSCVTIIGAFVAWYYVNNWKDQHLWKSRDDQLKSILNISIRLYDQLFSALTSLHSIEILRTDSERLTNFDTSLSPAIFNAHKTMQDLTSYYTFAAPLLSDELRSEAQAFIGHCNDFLNDITNTAKRLDVGIEGESDRIASTYFSTLYPIRLGLELALADEQHNKPTRRKLADDTIKNIKRLSKENTAT